MPLPVTQDFVKGINISLLPVVTASQLEQLVDAGRAASDKGLVIETVDAPPGTPVVPNPAGVYGIITPSWWTRYIWRRDTGTNLIYYKWDPHVAAHITFLKWVDLQGDIATALATANAAQVDATAAMADAATSLAASTTAVNTANAADGVADTALVTANNTAASVAVQLAAQALSIFVTGDIKPTLANDYYSLTADMGWLPLNGSEVPQLAFASLYAKCGVLFLAVAGPAANPLNFKLPDYRGRSPIMAGTGPGLTLRDLGFPYGTEVETLIEGQIPSKPHVHSIGIEAHNADGILETVTGTLLSVGGGGATEYAKTQVTPDVARTQLDAVVAAGPHPNLGPVFACNWLIKT